MPRRIPASGKQRKAKLLKKRAVKRGDIEPPLPTKPDRRRKRVRPRPNPGSAEEAQLLRNAANADAMRRLQSAFVKLPKEFLYETKRLAAALPLTRPIPSDRTLWNDDVLAAPRQSDSQGTAESDSQVARAAQLTCPRRPKWRYDMSKKEVEKNEEGLFSKWLDQTDALIAAELQSSATAPVADPEADTDVVDVDAERMPSAPTSFERNLEVWRQL